MPAKQAKAAAGGSICSKAELARELKLSRSRITQLCAKGLPVRADGKLDHDTAVQWVHDNNIPELGGWGKGQMRRSRPQRASAAGVAFQSPRATALRQLFDALNERSLLIPELALRAGVRDMNLIAALPGMFSDLVMELATDLFDEAYDWDHYDGPAVLTPPDYKALAAAYELPAPKKAAVNRILEKFDSVVYGETAEAK